MKNTENKDRKLEFVLNEENRLTKIYFGNGRDVTGGFTCELRPVFLEFTDKDMKRLLSFEKDGVKLVFPERHFPEARFPDGEFSRTSMIRYFMPQPYEVEAEVEFLPGELTTDEIRKISDYLDCLCDPLRGI